MLRSFGLLFTLCLSQNLIAADEYQLNIGHASSRQPAIIEFQLPPDAETSRRWELLDDGLEPIPTQPALGNPTRRIAVLQPQHRSPKYLLKAVPDDRVDPVPPSVRGPHLTERDGQLHLYDSPHEILSYHVATSRPPEGIADHYARSGHIHPLRTPDGEIVTAEFPEDHAHQHGVFFAWVNTQFAGHKVDFWNQGAKLGNVRHVQLTESVAGRVFAGFEAQLEHVDLTDGEKVVLQERWRVMTVALQSASDQPLFLIDLESSQLAATDTPLEIQEYHYGGFGWRGPTEWLMPKKSGDESSMKGCTFVTSLGDDREKGNHTRPQWVAVTGAVNDTPCTVAIFGHHANFRHPQPVRLHPDKPYFCFAPCVLGGFTIERTKPLISRYRIITHSGPANAKLYDELVKNWDGSVEVKVFR